MYSNPRTLFQHKVQGILQKKSSDRELLESIFQLQQLSLQERAVTRKEEQNWLTMMELFNKTGPAVFSSIVSTVKGRTISFPTEEEFQDSIITVLAYYYKEIEKRSWKEIAEILFLPDGSNVKYGIKVRQLQQFIQMRLVQALSKCEEDK